MAVPFVQLLSTVGDGTGTTDMVGDYSSVDGVFSVAGGAGDDAITIARLLIFVQDAGVFDAERYGNGIVLTNGIDLAVKDAAGTSTVVQLTPAPIKTSGDLSALAYDTQFVSVGTGDKYSTTRWTFSKFASPGLVLNKGQQLVATLSDDFTGLVHHRMTVQGTRPGDY